MADERLQDFYDYYSKQGWSSWAGLLTLSGWFAVLAVVCYLISHLLSYILLGIAIVPFLAVWNEVRYRKRLLKDLEWIDPSLRVRTRDN